MDPVTVNVLILTDDDGSYTQQHRFGLSELVSILRTQVKPYIKFAVTTAHRSKPSNTNPYPKDADIQGFDFTNPSHFKPANFDEIWFFGIANDNPDTGERHPLTEAEKEIVFRFMDSGGGVFATGDHEDLGIDLCGDIPRVRNMRRWQFNHAAVDTSYDNYDEGSGDSPPVLGPHRHDTLVAGHNTIYEFDDQSDDIPAKIIPKIYVSGSTTVVHSSPHPLLCGPSGVINILPDHMHEGECQVPGDLTQTITHGSYTAREYPPNPYNYQPIPDVIAHAVISPGHTTRLELKDSFGGAVGNTAQSSLPDDPVVDDYYGCIAAYDGQIANVGRVVVDSTFHHFFNINLIASGSNNTSDPVKSQGFNASPEGKASYEVIKAYYRNIAEWIAKPPAQMNMFKGILWNARWDSQLRMHPSRLGVSDRLDWVGYTAYGNIVLDVFARISSPCTVTRLFYTAIDPLALLLPNWLYVLLHAPDPGPIEYTKVVIDPELIVSAVFAGIMGQLIEAFPSRAQSNRENIQREMDGIIAKGIARGLERTAAAYRERLRESMKFIDTMEERSKQSIEGARPGQREGPG
jgi:hypothetical protein